MLQALEEHTVMPSGREIAVKTIPRQYNVRINYQECKISKNKLLILLGDRRLPCRTIVGNVLSVDTFRLLYFDAIAFPRHDGSSIR